MFVPYTHVIRLGKEDVHDYLSGKVYVTPKLDGTNASIWFDDGFHYGSRNREITKEKDNGRFVEYFETSDDDIVKMCKDFLITYPECRIYGEWLGFPGCKMLGSIKAYKTSGFFAFDIGCNGWYLTPDDIRYKELRNTLGPRFLAPVVVLSNSTENDILKYVDDNHYNLPDNIVGEGVVLKRYDYVNKYGEKHIAKIVRDEFKAEKSKKRVAEFENIESAIVDDYVTVADIEKCKAKVLLAEKQDEWDNTNGRLVGRLIGTVFRDLVEEELFSIVKKYKRPTIDFNKLEKLCSEKTRNAIGL